MLVRRDHERQGYHVFIPDTDRHVFAGLWWDLMRVLWYGLPDSTKTYEYTKENT